MVEVKLQTTIHQYTHHQQNLLGYLALKQQPSLMPAVLVVHDWSGRNEFACKKAELLAEMGYLGFAVDMYGDARTGQTNEEKTALMQSVAYSRQFLRERIVAAYNTVKSLPTVNPEKIAILGFCFGGLCALELARSGADICGAISFHGLLDKDTSLENNDIKAKVLALHGYDDPMVKPDNVSAFCQEMTDAKVDWQVHLYGNTMHAFTNPLANDQSFGTVYNAVAEKRSLQSMTNFLHEIFNERT